MLANRSALHTGYRFQTSDARQHQLIQSMDDVFSAATENIYVVKKKSGHGESFFCRWLAFHD